MPRKVVDPEELRQLTELFREPGAEAPERWAPSQLAEDISQLDIFYFANALWKGVISERDPQWIDKEIQRANARPRPPCAQAGPALKEMLTKGVSCQAITDLVRVFQ